MKHFLIFIVTLVSNAIFSCGFYPSGEDLRYSFLDPLHFKYYSYSDFNYSSNSFSPSEDSIGKELTIDGNEKLWIAYCQNKVSVDAIRKVLLEIDSKEINPQSSNEMIRYLYQSKDFEAVDYLKFAKSCEFFNGIYDDPWERKQMLVTPKRTKLIDKAIAVSNKITNKELKLRYTFLAIRLAYYNNDYATIRTLYDGVFKLEKNVQILNYWSLYFRTFAETDLALANYYAAQVFANAPDKRFMISGEYNRNVSINEVLKYANTNQEKANVYLLAGIKKTDQSLEYLKQIYKYNPEFEGLSFLLLREINKIEDWVFTPYYSLFSPSLSSYDDIQKNSIHDIMNRVERDRNYADQLLKFVNSVNFKKVDNILLWKICQAYLHFMTKDNQGCLSQISLLEKQISKSDPLYNQLEIIKALALTANQPKNEAVILEEVKPILLKNKNYKKFVFAIGRELEYKGNTTDAAFLYSKLNDKEADDDSYYNAAYWKNSKIKATYYTDYCSDYFDYINMFYSPLQVEKMVEEITNNKKDSDEFYVWKNTFIKNELPRLYDLIGTKYIRQNNLQRALFYFAKNEDKKEYKIDYSECLWEKEDCDGVYKNPFFVLKYTPGFVSQNNLFKLNKYAVTQQLISCLEKASNPKEKDRDYFYFLAANCYYNMTFYGSLPEMRRYGWQVQIIENPVEDNDEFYECNLAQKYYLVALKNAKTNKFKALCLRMIGKCEKNKLVHQFPNDYDNRIENYDNFILKKNKYYQDLKSKYSDDYEDLISDCNAFEEYFKSRR
ncbi:hypothetical protein GON26_19140 [Flavobacterium sp. GA093]|uniref:Uncharacterized protein n=1 Tax=Flavobacterium hydrocarbonoxydans TaxID=2683249 RepID=A0A6I4NVJ7_9FLAO|nr:hypothetical protein [Flavobacterium hydrocarbonoxydans]MWB96485.1 hypothetical protein [Flavobacterium hydrocarbonoxydans]